MGDIPPLGVFSRVLRKSRSGGRKVANKMCVKREKTKN